MCDGIRYYDPHQGFTTTESMELDDANGRMEDDFRGIIGHRGTLIIETPISADR